MVTTALGLPCAMLPRVDLPMQLATPFADSGGNLLKSPCRLAGTQIQENPASRITTLGEARARSQPAKSPHNTPKPVSLPRGFTPYPDRHAPSSSSIRLTADSHAEKSPGHAAGAAEAATKATVQVLDTNSRRVSASILVQAPLDFVWSVLTDYYRLADYVPSLARNDVLELREGGALLYQVGEQDVALGLKFQAKLVMDVQEEPLEWVPIKSQSDPIPGPIPDQEKDSVSASSAEESQAVAVVATVSREGSGEGSEGLMRRRGIKFTMCKGDFAGFNGRWLLEDLPRQSEAAVNATHGTGGATLLSYSVDVTPHFLLPVALIEARIVNEIGSNLAGIAAEACKRASYAM